MDAIFMNCENSFDPQRLLLSLTDKITRSDKHVALSKLSIYYTWKNSKSYTDIINLKYHSQKGMENFNYLMDHILYQIFKNIVNIPSKNTRLLLTILQQ